ncbi:MAG TPA: extracellular solute-binding protein [Candidatus Binatia bacterium]|jgi:iron(III) transport system substrate-binding protein|nr:extracellular solute-binding protein [Candidatus Binatia bacterium]
MKARLIAVNLLLSLSIYFLSLVEPGFVRADDRLVEGAKKEEELVLYSGMTVADATALLQAFEKKYPFIKARHQRSSGGKLIAQIQTEHRTKKYIWDVYAQAGLEGYVLLEEGHFAAYDSPERTYFPEGHKDSEGYWTTIYTSPMLATYNKKLVPTNEMPRQYFDLLEPKWKGKLGLDPRDVEWYANLKKIWGADRTKKFFLGLKMQDINLRQGRALLTELLGAGEFAILVNNYLQNAVESKQKGSPIEWLPLDPVIAGAGPVSINRHAPHPNAARLFVDFCLSKEGQETIVKHGRTSARRDIKGNPMDQIKNVRIVPSDLGLGKSYREAFGDLSELLGVGKK